MSKELKITKDKVLEASESCPDAKNVLKTLFPEAFEEEKEWEDITPHVRVVFSHISAGFYYLRLWDDSVEISHTSYADIRPFERYVRNGYKIEYDVANNFRILKRK